MAKHSDALTALVDSKWEVPETSDENKDTKSKAALQEASAAGSTSGGGGEEEAEAEAPLAEPPISFAHLAHQFKTMCFAYGLLQASSISLNIYNMFFFFPGQTNWAVVLACIVTQVRCCTPCSLACRWRARQMRCPRPAQYIHVMALAHPEGAEL